MMGASFSMEHTTRVFLMGRRQKDPLITDRKKWENVEGFL